jgi:type II secretory pathway pseudopilin PulG
MNHQKGQILLIAVMFVATVLTVFSAIAFRSTTETQTTKLEEESQKALAAAEAAIEAVLKQGNVVNIQSLPGFETSNITGQATVETTQSNNFTTPLLQKDEQYTLYLSNPGGTTDNPNFSQLTPSYNNRPLTICSTSLNSALEITIIKSDNSIKRFAINPPSSTIIQNGQTANSLGTCPNTESFNYRHQLSSSDIGSNNLLLIARVIGSGSVKLGFMAASGNLPFQGKTITSTAQSTIGVTKKVVLFQSYPQIPSEFFVTSF